MPLTPKSPHYLTCDGYDKAIPIHIVSQGNLEKWRETLDPAQSKWVTSNKFKANKNDILYLTNLHGDLSAVVMGLGPLAAPSVARALDPWLLCPLAQAVPEGHFRLVKEGLIESFGDTDFSLLSLGWVLAQYQFDRYLSKKNDRRAVLVLEDDAKRQEAETVINGIIMVRDLVNTPTCDMGPSHLSAIVKAVADHYGAHFTQTVGDDLLVKGYNTIHTVGRAAQNEPRLLDMTWGRPEAPKVTLVGKGVCFDTGGLDIKSSSGMRIMKKDMGGAAHTLALAQIIMESGIDVRLRLLIPAVENNISADAFRPGDIIKTYHGTTVEVGNTDAEGRLVLCDALALASEEDPELILDFATLTGAARVALGAAIVPFFTDGDALAASLFEHSNIENDPLWRMPLYAPYAQDLKSSCADLNNTGSSPFAGAITAALFLKHFVKNPEKWVHFDVYAWNLTDQPGRPQGGEAMAIRTVYAYLKNRFSTQTP